MLDDANFLITIFGPTGSGKTHRLHAMAKELGGADDPAQVLMVGMENVCHEVWGILRLHHALDTKAWKKKYVEVGNLLIDNIFLFKRYRSLAELFCEIITERQQAGRLTVMASEMTAEEWDTKNPAVAALLRKGSSIQADFDACAFSLERREKIKAELLSAYN